MHQIAEHVFCHRGPGPHDGGGRPETCNVYVLKAGSSAVLIDFGTGSVLDELHRIGVREVTDVLVTHHHRDQIQGLRRAADEGIRIWVPPVEADLIGDADRHWLTRSLDNDYDLRDDRFTLLRSVPPTGTVAEYRTRTYGGVTVYTLPTPGHTIGSVTYLVELDGRRYAFCGDLVYAPGKVWSLASTQWTYTGIEGQAATVHSCQDLLAEEPDVLLPSHGDPVDEPAPALGALIARLTELISMRLGKTWDPVGHRDDDWVPLTPHLLRSRTSFALTYALLSEDGTALLFDFGYDRATGSPSAADRASRRPLLGSLRTLRDRHGVDRVEVALPTHYHDDHVAGFNLLRDVEGTHIWAADTIAPVLARPTAYDLPCLWYDPIPVDRSLPLNRPIRWREYELTLHELPGHTVYAVAIELEVDGHRVVATGDQQGTGTASGERWTVLNYQYRNGFHPDDYIKSAELYLRLRPDLMVSGHWEPHWVDRPYLEHLLAEGRRLARLHRDLLPMEDFDFGRFGYGTRITPYRSSVAAGRVAEFAVVVRNPLPEAETLVTEFLAPDGWRVDDPVRRLRVPPGEEATAYYSVHTPAGARAERARVAVDLTAGRVRFGQVAEALVNLH